MQFENYEHLAIHQKRVIISFPLNLTDFGIVLHRWRLRHDISTRKQNERA